MRELSRQLFERPGLDDRLELRSDLFGFGSMPSADPAALVELTVTALQRTGRRGLIHGAWDGWRPDHLPGDILFLGAIGLLVGFLISAIRRRVEDAPTEITISQEPSAGNVRTSVVLFWRRNFRFSDFDSKSCIGKAFVTV